MSFHTPLQREAPSGQQATRRVVCDLSERPAVTTAELELLELWLGGVLAEILGSPWRDGSEQQDGRKEG